MTVNELRYVVEKALSEGKGNEEVKFGVKSIIENPRSSDATIKNEIIMIIGDNEILLG